MNTPTVPVFTDGSKYARLKRFFEENARATHRLALERCNLAYTKSNYALSRRVLYLVNKRKRRSQVTGDKADSSCEHSGLIHFREFGFLLPTPSEIVRSIRKGALRKKCRGAWYVANNRNGEMCFDDPQVFIRLYPNGTLRVLLRHKMTGEAVRDRTLALLQPPTATSNEACLERIAWLNSFTRTQQHTVYLTNQRLPQFRIDNYKATLGLSIFSDGSHPNGIEVHEVVPHYFLNLVAKLEALFKRLDELSSRPQST